MVTQVRFLTGVADKVALACRLARKKHREGGRVAIYGPPALLARVDHALWAEVALDFVPHLRLAPGDVPPRDAMRTAIWLLEAPVDALACDGAINLGFDDVGALGSHEVVAEVVSGEPADLAAGQQRWRQHKALGREISHHPQDAG